MAEQQIQPFSRGEVGQSISRRFGVNRNLLMGVGLGCILLGLASIVIPVSLFRSALRFSGAILLLSAMVKSLQLLLGRWRMGDNRRGILAIILEVLLDAGMGFVLLFHARFSAGVVAMLLGLLFAAEGLVLLLIALRSPTVTSRNVIMLCGFLTYIAGLVIALNLVAKPLSLVGLFVGIKLILFGLSLFWIALRAMGKQDAILYEAAMPEPIPAECYAVYFGTAFHLGIYIGDGKVVHYLNDNHVYQLTWEEFLLGRVPQHWTYPDLPKVTREEAIRTALAEVGKTYSYNLLKFNCEHFAIYCKTGGQTTQSKYAQIHGGMLDIGRHPILGMIAEMNTRMVEWLAFQFGGPAGKSISLAIRRMGATVMTWLVWLGDDRKRQSPGN